MKLPIVVNDYKKIILKNLIYLSAFIISPVWLLFPKDSIILSCLMGSVGVIWIIACVYANFKIFAFKKIGYIEFYQDYTHLLDLKINYKDIKCINFKYQDFYGGAYSYNGLNISHGGRNRITIFMNDGREITHRFFLENKKAFFLMKKIVIFLDENDIKVALEKYNRIFFIKYSLYIYKPKMRKFVFKFVFSKKELDFENQDI